MVNLIAWQFIAFSSYCYKLQYYFDAFNRIIQFFTSVPLFMYLLITPFFISIHLLTTTLYTSDNLIVDWSFIHQFSLFLNNPFNHLSMVSYWIPLLFISDLWLLEQPLLHHFWLTHLFKPPGFDYFLNNPLFIINILLWKPFFTYYISLKFIH